MSYFNALLLDVRRQTYHDDRKLLGRALQGAQGFQHRIYSTVFKEGSSWRWR